MNTAMSQINSGPMIVPIHKPEGGTCNATARSSLLVKLRNVCGRTFEKLNGAFDRAAQMSERVDELREQTFVRIALHRGC